MNILDPTPLVDRYVSMWNEPDAEFRRQLIAELWEPDGCHVLQAPLEIRQTAARLGFPRVEFEVRGYDELQFRVTQAFNEFIAAGVYRFRSRGNAARLGELIKFNWEMIETATDVVVGVGTEIVFVGLSGRILRDCQFIED